MDNAHIVKSFDQDLGRIESLLLEMGGIVETQIEECIEALVVRDGDLARKVREDDRKVDELDEQIDEATVLLIARRQPVADDLRSTVCALKVSNNLERIGDYAKNIAKRSSVISEFGQIGSSVNTLKRMSRMVQQMLREVLDAYVARDLEMAAEIRRRDEEVDHMHNTLFRELLTHMMEDARNITPGMHLLFIAKNLERIGDHATGIAEEVTFLVNGVRPDDERPKSDLTSVMGGAEKKA